MFLVLHKVYGEPGYDVATQMECPMCAEHKESLARESSPSEKPDGACRECGGTGYWWIVPSSGRRAYPILFWNLADVADLPSDDDIKNHQHWVRLPEHYRRSK